MLLYKYTSTKELEVKQSGQKKVLVSIPRLGVLRE